MSLLSVILTTYSLLCSSLIQHALLLVVSIFLNFVLLLIDDKKNRHRAGHRLELIQQAPSTSKLQIISIEIGNFLNRENIREQQLTIEIIDLIEEDTISLDNFKNTLSHFNAESQSSASQTSDFAVKIREEIETIADNITDSLLRQKWSLLYWLFTFSNNNLKREIMKSSYR